MFARQLGVVEIQVIKKANAIVYHAKTKRDIRVNGQELIFSNYDITLTNQALRLGKCQLSLDASGDWYLTTPYYSGKFKNTPDRVFTKSVEVALLALWKYEITSFAYQPKKLNLKMAPQLPHDKGCSFWDTYTAVGVGATSSGAHSNCLYDAQSLGSDCVALGPPAEEFGMPGLHIWAQSFCCE